MTIFGWAFRRRSEPEPPAAVEPAPGGHAIVMRDQGSLTIYTASSREPPSDFSVQGPDGERPLTVADFRDVSNVPFDHLPERRAANDPGSWRGLKPEDRGATANHHPTIHKGRSDVLAIHGKKAEPDSFVAVFVDPQWGDRLPVRGGRIFTLSGRVATHRCAALIRAVFLDAELVPVATMQADVPRGWVGWGEDESFFQVAAGAEVPETARFVRLTVEKGKTRDGEDSWLFFYDVSLVGGPVSGELLPKPAREGALFAASRQVPFFVARIAVADRQAALTRLVAPPEIQVSEGPMPLVVPGDLRHLDPNPFLRPQAKWGRQVRVDIGIVLFENSAEEVTLSVRNVEAACRWASEALAREAISMVVSATYMDNSGTDRLSAYMRPPGSYRRDGSNRGFGGSHNILMDESFEGGADYYLMLNPDGFPRFDCLLELLLQARRRDAGLVEAIQVPQEHPKAWDRFTGETAWCSGAALLVSREAHLATGGFDPNIVMYCEDVDLSWRVRRSGLPICVAPKAFFFHDVGERSSRFGRQAQLLSGRYLARKWGSKPFEEEMEAALIAEGFAGDRRDLPPIPAHQSFATDMEAGIANFSHGMTFAPPRW